MIDLIWLLRELLPWRLHILNVGCEKYREDDPTHLLVRDHVGQISGFCVDNVPEHLVKADTWLRSLGDKTRNFITIADRVTP